MTFKQVAQWMGAGLLAVGLLMNGNALAQTGPAAPAAPAVVLYDQTDNPGTNTADSSDWGSHFPILLSQAADDFVVPNSAIWKLTGVTASGYIGPGTGAGVLSLLIQIYNTTTNGLPSSLVYSQTVASGSIGGLDTGVLVVTLNSALTLGPGHYWFSAQARQDCTDSSCKHWVWTERTSQSNSESVWQNPSNSYGTGCTTWQPRVTVCHRPSESVSPDLLFKLSGVLAPVAAHLYLPITRRP